MTLKKVFGRNGRAILDIWIYFDENHPESTKNFNFVQKN